MYCNGASKDAEFIKINSVFVKQNKKVVLFERSCGQSGKVLNFCYSETVNFYGQKGITVTWGNREYLYGGSNDVELEKVVILSHMLLFHDSFLYSLSICVHNVTYIYCK